MSAEEHHWWNGFFAGMIWLAIGLSAINVVLLIAIMTGSMTPIIAIYASAISTAVLLLSSVGMHRLALKEQRRYEND